jgi:hypothetical protein
MLVPRRLLRRRLRAARRSKRPLKTRSARWRAPREACGRSPPRRPSRRPRRARTGPRGEDRPRRPRLPAIAQHSGERERLVHGGLAGDERPAPLLQDQPLRLHVTTSAAARARASSLPRSGDPPPLPCDAPAAAAQTLRLCCWAPPRWPGAWAGRTGPTSGGRSFQPGPLLVRRTACHRRRGRAVSLGEQRPARRGLRLRPLGRAYPRSPPAPSRAARLA